MTESIEPNSSRKEFNEDANREIDSEFESIMQQEFPDGIEQAAVESPIPTPGFESLGSDITIARAHIEDMRELVAETQKKHAELQAELDRKIHEGLTDSLTGMPNREAFVGWLDQKIASKQSDKLTIGFLDMDKLKTINDTYGHELADDVIRRIGEILKSNVRDGEDMIAAHRSGDEFLIGIIGAETSRIKEFTDTTLRAINRIHVRKNPDGNSEIIELDPEDNSVTGGDLHQISASIGIASMSDSMDTTQLMNSADKAMYEAKRNGRNQTVIIDSPHRS